MTDDIARLRRERDEARSMVRSLLDVMDTMAFDRAMRECHVAARHVREWDREPRIEWREGDRVEICKSGWGGGKFGRVTTNPLGYGPCVFVAIDGQDGVFMFLDHELTRVTDGASA